MKVAVTGGTGFLGRYIVRQLAASGHLLRCWSRRQSNRNGFDEAIDKIEWITGSLAKPHTVRPLLAGCDALVHAALDRPGSGFAGSEGDLATFAERNIVGTLRLVEMARAVGVKRCIYISSCAVHDVILNDRPLDESHPTWAQTHYGAHKAAVESFIHAYGLGGQYPICALRPCGIYGVAEPAQDSKWFELVKNVANGQTVDCRTGGKEVHAADVARAVELLLNVPEEQMRGQAFNCCDRYISQYDVARLAKLLSGSSADVRGEPTQPKNTIVTDKLCRLGFAFGGDERLHQTVTELLAAVRTPKSTSEQTLTRGTSAETTSSS